jgi:mono/diheme cytochrome c family protein
VRLWLILVTLCIFSAFSRNAAAQTRKPSKKPAPCADSTTTRTGVYTAQQAVRGKDIYAGNCRSCHTPETHTGATFNAIWNKRSLAELYSYIRERMPKNEPGSLSDQEYADVLAYVLKMNKMPAGRAELAPDSAAMKSIRIVLTRSP